MLLSLTYVYLELVGVKIVPFRAVSQLYGLYHIDCKDNGIAPLDMASAPTFRRAWKKLKRAGVVKLLTCKGAFRTCLTCNVTDEMLMNASKLHSMFTNHSFINCSLCLLFR